MDMYFRVSSFSSLRCDKAWFIFNCARVDFVWRDEVNNRLILGLIDQNRQKMMAVASGQIIQLHQAINLVGRLYNITHFQVDEDPNDYLRYEGYAVIRSPYVIKINPNTQFIFLGPCIERLFPTHPWVSSIEALERNERQKNMIDVVGKIVGGGRYGRRNYVCEMILQDRSGYVISLILFYDPQITPFMAARAIGQNFIIYSSSCKLVTRIGRMNYLNSTPLTRIEYNPVMPEAEAIRDLYG